MDNPEKLATYGTQDEDKQNKNTTQYVCWVPLRSTHLKIFVQTTMCITIRLVLTIL
jgi:hypothetical protein